MIVTVTRKPAPIDIVKLELSTEDLGNMVFALQLAIGICTQYHPYHLNTDKIRRTLYEPLMEAVHSKEGEK